MIPTEPRDDLLTAEAYAVFDELRTITPVRWSERHEAWLPTRYAEVSARGGRLPRSRSGGPMAGNVAQRSGVRLTAW